MAGRGSRPRRIAVVMSGCGVFDGTEIHEATFALLALDQAGAEAVCTAPNVAQGQVTNHLTGDGMPGETRNVLVESARIARGRIVDLATLRAADLDGAVFPGGFGVTRNLTGYATAGRGAAVQPEVARLVRELHAAGKPLGFACTAPLIAARVLGAEHPRVTVGNDVATAADVEAWGARHQAAAVRDVVVDRDLRVVTTPAYMLARRISEVADGIEKLVRAVLEMA